MRSDAWETFLSPAAGRIGMLPDGRARTGADLAVYRHPTGVERSELVRRAGRWPGHCLCHLRLPRGALEVPDVRSIVCPRCRHLVWSLLLSEVGLADVLE